MRDPEPVADLRVGTCGWSSAAWKEHFYPPHLPPAERLAFYATRFRCVEIDTTFHRMPEPHVVRHWAEAVPDSFTFCPKAPQRITHEGPLCDHLDGLRFFCDAVDLLGPKLGPILLQLPPSYSPHANERDLWRFLEQLPRGFRFAMEFRDPRAHRPSVIRLLEQHRVCWVWHDQTDHAHGGRGPFTFQPVTAPFLYLRLLGDLHDAAPAPHPRPDALESWAVRVRQHLASLESVFILACDSYEGSAPDTCARILHLLGSDLPADPPALFPVPA